MKPLLKTSLFTGALTALVVSIFHSLSFRFEVFGWSGLLVWFLASLLVGGTAGFFAGLLISLIPVHLGSSIAYIGGVVFGAIGYYIQVYLFLLYFLSHVSWE